MIQLRCTQKLLKEWHIKPGELAEIKDDLSALGNWYAHVFNLDRRKTVIFVNDKTLTSFIIIGVKKDDFDKLTRAFLAGVAQVLLLLGVTKDKVAQILTDYHEIEITKTASRRILGVMNDLVNHYKSHVQLRGGLKYSDLDEIIFLTNDIPQRTLNQLKTIDYLHKVINENF